MSDLHIDINPWDWSLLEGLPSDVNTVVVAGDISNDVWETCHWLVELKRRFENVLWVAGNHDFYNLGFHRTRLVQSREWATKWPTPKTVPEMIEHYARWSQENGIVFLHRSCAVIDGVTFIGATGWHDYQAGHPLSTEAQIEAWYDRLNDTTIMWRDPHKIDHLAPIEAGMKDACYLETAAGELTGPAVVITHHIPHRSCLTHRPHDIVWHSLHGSFANTLLERVRSDHIRYWVFGHTHSRSMRNVDGIEYVNNSKGYPGECSRWEPIVLDI